MGKRLAKGVTQFLVKWAGYDHKDNTWEPVEHLAGCEAFIADFMSRENTRLAQLDAVATAKRQEKAELDAKAAADAVVVAAAARLPCVAEDSLAFITSIGDGATQPG